MALVLLAASLPLVFLVERIARWGVDAPFIDDWSIVDDLDKYSRGAWTIDDLLRSHNGHRIFLLRLIRVPLAFVTGWNLRVEMFLQVAVAVATFALFARALRRALGTGPTFAGCLFLSSVAVFSLSQSENWMWGFQLNVALAVFFTVLALTCLSENPSWRGTALSLLAAVLASLSQAAGLTVWPAGIVAIAVVPSPARARMWRLGVWAVAGAALLAFYTLSRPGDVGAPRPSGFVLAHPGAYLAFVLTVIGGPLVSYTGAPWPPHDHGIAALMALAGLGVLALGWRALRDQPEVRRALAPLLVVALWSALVAIQVGLGRAEGGRPQAMASRYMAFTTPFWLAVIGVLGALALHRPSRRTGARLTLAAVAASLLVSSWWHVGAFETRWKAVWPALAEARDADAPDRVLAMFHPEVQQVRSGMGVLRRLRLSFFRVGFEAPLPAVRLQSFAQSLRVTSPLPTFTAAQVARVRVAVANPTPARWSALGRGGWVQERAVRLAYRWLTPEGRVVVEDGLRTDLPRDLLGGEEVELAATVQAPESPGRFTLRLTLVQEGVAWFDARGAATLDLPVDVHPGR